MHRFRSVAAFALASMLVVGAAACSSDDGDEGSSSDTTEAEADDVVASQEICDGVLGFTLTTEQADLFPEDLQDDAEAYLAARAPNVAEGEEAGDPPQTPELRAFLATCNQ